MVCRSAIVLYNYEYIPYSERDTSMMVPLTMTMTSFIQIEYKHIHGSIELLRSKQKNILQCRKYTILKT